MSNFGEKIGRIEANIEEIMRILRDHDRRYAPFWIKYPVWGMTAGTFLWALSQLLNLIPQVKALF